ncbi:MAG: MmgE/PrpD family protein [Bacillota bacterium]
MYRSLSHMLGEFAAGADAARLPPAAVAAARRCFLDWLGSAIAGSASAPGRIMLAVVEALGGHPQATLVPVGLRLPVTGAALYNGAVSHVVELDDVHRESIMHPGAAVIPAALAAAEMVGATGREFMAAVVAGYEVAIRVAEAVTPSHYRYWHTTATCGTFGAAAASAKLLGLDGEGIASALGSAGTQAAGLWEFIADGAMSKHLHPGKAAMNGVLSALLAREGFSAASRILEGEKGFFRATAATFDESRVGEGLGESFKITGVSFKVHASCRHTHPAVDAALEVVRRHRPDPAAVSSVLVHTYSVALDVAGNPRPASVYSAKFSLPFCVALAICRGRAGPGEFSTGALEDPDIKGVMERVQVVVNPAFDAVYPTRWPARVTVRMNDGSELTGETHHPRGDPENPLGTDELEEKFRALVVPVVGDTAAEGLIERARSLESVADMGEFMSCFGHQA